MSVKRVAIMTGGGDCPGLNAVIRAAVRVGKERFGWEMLGVEDAFSGLIDLDYKSPHGNLWLEPSHVRGILERVAGGGRWPQLAPRHATECPGAPDYSQNIREPSHIDWSPKTYIT